LAESLEQLNGMKELLEKQELQRASEQTAEFHQREEEEYAKMSSELFEEKQDAALLEAELTLSQTREEQLRQLYEKGTENVI